MWPARTNATLDTHTHTHTHTHTLNMHTSQVRPCFIQYRLFHSSFTIVPNSAVKSIVSFYSSCQSSIDSGQLHICAHVWVRWQTPVLHCSLNKQKHMRVVFYIFVCSLKCMWLIILFVCVEVLCKNTISRRVQIVLKEVFAFCKRCVTFLHVVCVFCGFVCRVLRNAAIVSNTVCKHFEKNCMIPVCLNNHQAPVVQKD